METRDPDPKRVRQLCLTKGRTDSGCYCLYLKINPPYFREYFTYSRILEGVGKVQ